MLLGIDVGTTGAKAMVFTPEGEVKGYAFEEYGIIYTPEGYAEQDAEDVWQAAKRVIKRAASDCGREIRSISLSVQGDAVIAIDRGRRAISRAHLGMDYRGQAEAEACEKQSGAKEIFRHTGMRPHPMNTFIKILWIKNHNRELYDRTYKFVTYADFIMGKLGSDSIVIDYTMASRTQAFDLQKRIWSREILEQYGVDEMKLAFPTASGTIVGKLDRRLAEELGISEEAVLVTGGHDQTCAAIGAGITREGMALDSHGTAEVISTVLGSPRVGDVMYDSFYPCYIHALPEMYFTFSLNHTGGALLKWFAEEYCLADRREAEKADKGLYEYIIERMPEAPSPVMFLPYLNGSGTPTCDLKMKGAILGLTMASDRYDIAKAVLESLCYEMRLNLGQMKEAGIHVEHVRCVGGGARSPIGLQMKADIMGIPVTTLKVREAACFGAAIVAGRAAGIYRGTEDIDRLVKTDRVYEPRESVQKQYEERCRIYQGLYGTMRETMYRL